VASGATARRGKLPPIKLQSSAGTLDRSRLGLRAVSHARDPFGGEVDSESGQALRVALSAHEERVAAMGRRSPSRVFLGRLCAGAGPPLRPVWQRRGTGCEVDAAAISANVPGALGPRQGGQKLSSLRAYRNRPVIGPRARSGLRARRTSAMGSQAHGSR